MSDIDINRVLQNIGELQDQNAIDFQHWKILQCEIEKLKKDNDIQTYKEIVAFSEGKKLNMIDKQVKIGKRPYQKILLAVGSAIITMLICFLIGLLINFFLN